MESFYRGDGGGGHTGIETHAWLLQKILGPLYISHFVVLQVPSNKLSSQAGIAYGKGSLGPGDQLLKAHPVQMPGEPWSNPGKYVKGKQPHLGFEPR